MWRVIDKKHHDMSRDNDYSEFEEIARVDEEFDVKKINGKMYSCGIKYLKHKILFVTEFTFKDEVEETYNDDDFECPYCGAMISDSWEYGYGEQDIECDTCRKLFHAEAEACVTYKAAPKRADNV